MSESATDKHQELLEQLNSNIEKQNSFAHTFKRGIFRGLGTAIGATVIAAIAFAIFGQVVDSVDDVPIIRDIIDQANIEATVEENI